MQCMANHGNIIQGESVYMEIGDLEVLFGSYDSLFAVGLIDFDLLAKEKLQKRQVEIDEMVIETSQRFFRSFSSAFG